MCVYCNLNKYICFNNYNLNIKKRNYDGVLAKKG